MDIEPLQNLQNDQTPRALKDVVNLLFEQSAGYYIPPKEDLIPYDGFRLPANILPMQDDFDSEGLLAFTNLDRTAFIEVEAKKTEYFPDLYGAYEFRICRVDHIDAKEQRYIQLKFNSLQSPFEESKIEFIRYKPETNEITGSAIVGTTPDNTPVIYLNFLFTSQEHENEGKGVNLTIARKPDGSKAVYMTTILNGRDYESQALLENFEPINPSQMTETQPYIDQLMKEYEAVLGIPNAQYSLDLFQSFDDLYTSLRMHTQSSMMLS